MSQILWTVMFTILTMDIMSKSVTSKLLSIHIDIDTEDSTEHSQYDNKIMDNEDNKTFFFKIINAIHNITSPDISFDLSPKLTFQLIWWSIIAVVIYVLITFYVPLIRFAPRAFIDANDVVVMHDVNGPPHIPE